MSWAWSFREVEQDEKVIDRMAAAQREELEQEIATLQAAGQSEEEAVCQGVPVMIRKWYCVTKPRAD